MILVDFLENGRFSEPKRGFISGFFGRILLKSDGEKRLRWKRINSAVDECGQVGAKGKHMRSNVRKVMGLNNEYI